VHVVHGNTAAGAAQSVQDGGGRVLCDDDDDAGVIALSDCFTIDNVTRQGAVLSPYLFSGYIRGILHSITESCIGCYMFAQAVCV